MPLRSDHALLYSTLLLALGCGGGGDAPRDPAGEAMPGAPAPRTDTLGSMETPLPFDTVSRVDIGGTVGDTVVPRREP